MAWTTNTTPIPERFTFDSIDADVSKLTAQEVVYKVDVDEIKARMATGFEKHVDREIRSAYFHAGKWKDLPTDEQGLMDDIPFEMRHWYGKKFSQTLTQAPLTEMPDKVRSIRNRWRPVFNRVQALIKRQTKGRKPRPANPDQEMRDQSRATCSCCFREIAVNGGAIIHDHGFEISHGFRNGVCAGAGQIHFGTEDGRDLARGFAKNYRRLGTETKENAAYMRENSAAILSGEITKYTFTNSRGKPTDPTQRLIDLRVYEIEAHARQLDSHAEYIEKRVEGWKAADPIIVKVPAN